MEAGNRGSLFQGASVFSVRQEVRWAPDREERQGAPEVKEREVGLLGTHRRS